MKKVIIFIFLTISISCFSIAQNASTIDSNDITNVSISKNNDPSIYKRDGNFFLIKISPLQIMGGDFITNSYSVGFSVENAIKKPYSFHFGARYIFTDKNDFLEKRMIVVYVEQVNGFGIDAEFRRYSTKKPEMAGYYLSLNLKTVYTKAIYSGFIVKRSSFSTYVNIGWQKLYRSGFVFDIAVGVGLRFVTSNSDTGSNPIYRTSEHISDGGKKLYHSGSALFPFVNLNLNIGYAFKVKAKK